MKAWIKVEDSEEFRRVAQAKDMARALYQIDSLFWKYAEMYERGNMIKMDYDTVKKIWKEFRDIKDECGINLEELYT